MTEAGLGSRSAVFPNTIIVYQRQDGTANTLQQWTFYHTGRILAVDGTEWQSPAERIKPLFSLVEALDYWGLKDTYAPTDACSGCQAHIITVYREGKIKKVVVTQGVELPSNLQRALDEIGSLIAK